MQRTLTRASDATLEGVFTLVTSSCFLDVDCSFLDVNIKI